ncbi:hypothetical protein P8A21_27320 [Streptomyces poriferorum]|uniref:Uncharacterized protein n=2 Tax=Streptomyces poriferorum TaxID=2798799 RepID=A0ABY9IM34_9ACTN|nr:MULTISPECIES: hypothetical protein [Streptomyces]MBW5260458.1 hypothetical protein [Streptomyces poriferorum]MDP5314732.1 hypothetical protein [Streptomyces sp. Alt4]WLQ50963.1 hypothetical protein P8A21_27320 [Streptomyces sp. Alt1]WLQ56373.1 hypothetical protein P8A19_13375 [Streptomyces sp. Alt2]
MTMPPPQPPQGPYGAPQPPQGPYGAPQGPYGPPQQPQQNHPYAQQPVPGQQQPYGYPQAPQPWGAPAPGAPGWPGMPPPRRNRTGLIVGITLGGLVVAGCAAFGVSRLVDEVDKAGGIPSAGEFPAAEYRLTVPKKLLDDEYTLLKDSSSTDGKDIEGTYDPTIRDAKAVVTQYTSESGGTLVISGMWGRIKGPEFTRDKILEGAVQNEGMTIAVPAREFTPGGYGITVSCQVVRSKEGGVTSTLPMCAWGDDNTASFVAVITAETALQDPAEVDLDKAALDTAKVRAESRKPIAATEAG